MKKGPGIRSEVIVLALCLSVPAALRAQGDHWEAESRAVLARASDTLARHGFRPTSAPVMAMLREGESVTFTMPLRGGRTYAILAACDEDCALLDLVAIDDRHYELGADRGSSALPILHLAPDRDAVVQLTLVMGRCRVNPCRAGLLALAGGSRPIPP